MLFENANSLSIYVDVIHSQISIINFSCNNVSNALIFSSVHLHSWVIPKSRCMVCRLLMKCLMPDESNGDCWCARSLLKGMNFLFPLVIACQMMCHIRSTL